MIKNYLRDVIEPAVGEALTGHSLSEDITYDATVMMLPTEAGPQPALLLTLMIPSPLIGQQISGAAVLPGLPNPLAVGQAVSNVLGDLQQRRAESLVVTK